MIVDFRELGISEDLTGLLKKNGITVPTPVQEQSIQYIRSGRDLIAQAQTGTGMTLAFLLPLFEDIDISNTMESGKPEEENKKKQLMSLLKQ